MWTIYHSDTRVSVKTEACLARSAVMSKFAPLLILFILGASLAGAHLTLLVHEQAEQLAMLNARQAYGVPCAPGGGPRLLP